MQELDLSGLKCPLPLMRLKKYAKALAPGTEFVVRATDPGTVTDFQGFCVTMGHTLLRHEAAAGVFSFYIKIKG